MVGLTIVYYLDHQLLAYQSVDWLHIQMHDSIALQVSESMNEVQEEADLGP